jgi:hypothetical protein
MENQESQEFLKPQINPNFEHMFQKKEGVTELEEETPVQKKEEKRQTLHLAPPDVVEQEEETEEASEKQVKEEKKKHTDWKAQAEKESKRLKETQKWANETKAQISAYKRAVEKFVNEGLLDQEDAQSLLDHTQYSDIPENTLSEKEKASKIFREEIENIKKYGNYDNLDEHVKALDHMVENSTKEEIDDLFGDIKELVDEDSVLFTKKILEVAAEYYDDVYEDLSKAGSLKNLKLEYQNELSKRDKLIDKLEKEMIKLKKRHEDYDDSPQHRIPQGGGDRVGASAGKSNNIMKDPGGFMEDLHRGKYRN